MTEARSRLPLTGTLAGLTFGAGLFSLFTIPGGGDVTDKQFADFYASGAHRATAFLLYLVLIVGAWLMLRFFSELRSRLEPGPAGAFGQRLAVVGTACVIVGGALDLAPLSVQVNSGRPFVGVAIALTFAQAGLLIFVMGGIFSFALATFNLCRHARRAGALPRWVATTGMVVAVLLVTAYIVAPAVLLPAWVILAGLTARRSPGPLSPPVHAATARVAA